MNTKKIISFFIITLSLFSLSMAVFASSHSLRWSFDSNLYGSNRYFKNGKNFKFKTNSTCTARTKVDLKLWKMSSKNSLVGYISDTGFMKADGKDTEKFDGKGKGYYRLSFHKPKNTYGDWCTGNGKLSD